MVPFSFPEPLLKSRVMNEYISSSATVGVWALGASPKPPSSEAHGKGDPWLGGKSVRRGGASNDSRGGCAPQNEDGSSVTLVYPVNSVILSKVKITKRTQFKNRTTRHLCQLRRTT
jgi:hypothetical protein